VGSGTTESGLALGVQD